MQESSQAMASAVATMAGSILAFTLALPTYLITFLDSLTE